MGYLKEDVPKSDKGWWIVSLLCLNAVCQTVLLHQYFHICFRTGMHIKAATAAIVFRKALVLDPAAMSENVVEEKKKKKIEKEESKESDEEKKQEKNKKKLNSRGAIVNLMSVDAQRLQDLCPYLHMLWSGPYQICLALYVWCSISFISLSFIISTYTLRTQQVLSLQRAWRIHRSWCHDHDLDDSDLGIHHDESTCTSKTFDETKRRENESHERGIEWNAYLEIERVGSSFLGTNQIDSRHGDGTSLELHVHDTVGCTVLVISTRTCLEFHVRGICVVWR